MQQVAVTEVQENGATIPTEVLRALGVARGDRVAFVAKDDGTIALTKAAPPGQKRPIRDFIGILSTNDQRSLDQELALLREMRYGDEVEGVC
jgi:bifunctional DNA-binding transcriptional regulator/antitoxin component of YhaV-PrlF toxin-antitoxin module